MSVLASELNLKLQRWKPQTSQEVRDLIYEIIKRADDDSLDLSRSRLVEQEVLNLIDEP